MGFDGFIFPKTGLPKTENKNLNTYKYLHVEFTKGISKSTYKPAFNSYLNPQKPLHKSRKQTYITNNKSTNLGHLYDFLTYCFSSFYKL